jgi:hypothetical protein
LIENHINDKVDLLVKPILNMASKGIVFLYPPICKGLVLWWKHEGNY